MIAKSGFGDIALVVAALIAAVVILRSIARWARHVIAQWLPRPFLGDDSNMEWAQPKRIELSAGIFDWSKHIPSESGHGSNIHCRPEVVHNEKGPKFAYEYKLDEPQEELSGVWLQDASRIEDQ